MTTWQNILGIAAIGTERQEVTLPPSDSLLGRTLNTLDVFDREGALLSAVALASLHRQAGFRAPADTLPLPEVSAAEQLPRCSVAAGRHLALMLGGAFKDVLPEWLAALRDAGRRVREEHLPALLDKGSTERALRALVVEVLGNRGRWLAAQNAAWSWASAGVGPDGWETAGRNERLALLRSLRETDSRRAVELLSSTWKSEPAKDRASFLQTFHVGLNEEDEPFLTEALEDRGADVRRTAVALLLRLPSSRLMRLVSERVGSLLRYRKPTLRKPLLEVNLPDDPEKWQKENQLPWEFPASVPPLPSMGQKGFWLLRAVGCVPPAMWCAAWGKSPSEVLAAASNSEWSEALLSGMAVASARLGDAEWIEALLSDRELRQALFRVSGSTVLISRMPADRLEALALKELSAARAGARLDDSALRILWSHDGRWSEELSRAVVESVKGGILGRTNESFGWQLISGLGRVALHAPPTLADELTSDWPTYTEGVWQKDIEGFHSVLGFRRDMLRAIAKEETEV